MNGHPKWKIITGFSLCPALGGLILGGTVLVNSLVDPSRNEGVFLLFALAWHLLFLQYWSLLFSILSLHFFFL
ncbi:hypothetical protein [Microvirgula aerodenitrificans]|uniref:hypothetical protein n=1 Tax=Microvirgula aerodenitrificans TaxID=57480 RepID=UPI00248D98F7|nr:hypothetical protein [Microvirgula aerodenitrificans]